MKKNMKTGLLKESFCLKLKRTLFKLGLQLIVKILVLNLAGNQLKGAQ